MIITAIKSQLKNDNRVSVFVDNKYSFSLSLDQLLDQKIKKNNEINEFQIKNFKKLSDEGKLKQRTLEWVLRRPHSIREFRDYLYKKQAEKDLTEAFIEEFLEKKYLNDEYFAKWFAENRRSKNKSSRAIVSELSAKGISPGISRKVLEELEGQDKHLENGSSEQEALAKLIDKVKGKSKYQDKQKFITYLISKGFNYQDVKIALEDMTFSQNRS